MSGEQKDKREMYVEWGYRLIVLLGIVATLWLNQNYVRRDEFAKMDDRQRRVEDILIRMEAGIETDKRHDVQLADHEARLRALEKRTP